MISPYGLGKLGRLRGVPHHLGALFHRVGAWGNLVMPANIPVDLPTLLRHIDITSASLCGIYRLFLGKRGLFMRAQRLWLIGFVVLLTAQAQAASIGVFCWQLLPTPDTVCFDVDNAPQQAHAATLVGTTFLVGSYRYPVTGVVAFNENSGVFDMSWTTYFSNRAFFNAVLNPQSLEGPFFASDGSLGTMHFIGMGSSAAVGSDENVGGNQVDPRTLLEQMR